MQGIKASRRLLTVVSAALVVVLLGAAGARAAVNVPVTPNVPFAYQEPTLAVNPVNSSQLAVSYDQKTNTQTCYVSTSADGGRTWSQTAVVGTGARIALPSAYPTCYAPRIAYGPSGELYYVYQAAVTGRSRTPRQVWITTSLDGGRTFGSPVLLDATTERDLFAQVAVAVDQASGRVYVGWTSQSDPHVTSDPEHRRAMVASSIDEGRSFSTPVQVNRSDPTSGTLTDPWVTVEPNGTVAFGWEVEHGNGRTSPFVASIYVATSTNHGQTFGTPAFVLNDDPGCTRLTAPTCTRPIEYAASHVAFSLGAGIRPGQLYVVSWKPEGYVDANPRRIVFSASGNGGASWSTARVIGVPAGRDGDDQARPWMAITPGGGIEIVYQDLATISGGHQDIFETHSSDGGASFSAPLMLDSASSNSTIGPGSFYPGTADLGAHETVATAGCKVFTAWTDTRRGTATTGKQDIFFAPLSLPARECKAIGKLTLLSNKLTVLRRSVLVPLRCQSQFPCNGTFSIDTRARLKGGELATVVCTKSRTTFFSIRAGRRKTARPGFTQACMSLLRKARNHTIHAKLTSRPRTGQQGLIKRVTLTLR